MVSEEAILIIRQDARILIIDLISLEEVLDLASIILQEEPYQEEGLIQQRQIEEIQLEEALQILQDQELQDLILQDQ